MVYTSPSSINLTSSEGMGNILIYLNEVTKSWFSNMFLIAIFVIFFMGYLRTNKDDYIGAFAVSSYITFGLTILLWIIGFASNYAIGISLGLTAISSVILFTNRD